jgi:hypothetical protein
MGLRGCEWGGLTLEQRPDETVSGELLELSDEVDESMGRRPGCSDGDIRYRCRLNYHTQGNLNIRRARPHAALSNRESYIRPVPSVRMVNGYMQWPARGRFGA